MGVSLQVQGVQGVHIKQKRRKNDEHIQELGQQLFFGICKNTCAEEKDLMRNHDFHIQILDLLDFGKPLLIPPLTTGWQLCTSITEDPPWTQKRRRKLFMFGTMAERFGWFVPQVFYISKWEIESSTLKRGRDPCSPILWCLAAVWAHTLLHLHICSNTPVSHQYTQVKTLRLLTVIMFELWLLTWSSLIVTAMIPVSMFCCAPA